MNTSTKKTLAGISIVGLIIATALLIYAILITPTKQPYRDALAQYKNVASANALLTATGSNLNATSATDEDFEKSIKNAQAALEAVKKENASLAKAAVLTTGEGKTLYVAFNDKLQPYLAYNAAVLTSMQKVRPVLHACNEDMGNITTDAKSIASIRTCATNLGALSDIEDEDYATLVVALKTDYESLANVLEKMAAVTDPDGAGAAEYKELEGQRDQILQDLKTSSLTFTSSVKEHRIAVLTSDAADKLQQYLEAKSNIF